MGRRGLGGGGGGGGGLLEPWRRGRLLWQFSSRISSYSTASPIQTPSESGGRILPPKSRLTWVIFLAVREGMVVLVWEILWSLRHGWDFVSVQFRFVLWV